MSSKSSQNRRLGRVLGALGRPGGVLGRLGASCGRPWGVLGRLGSKKVANMAPTWSPKRSQNREKIEAKIDQNFDGSWGRIFEGFWWIWKGKMEPSWHQNRTKNPCEHRNAILRKSCSHSCGGVNFLDSGIQVGLVGSEMCIRDRKWRQVGSEIEPKIHVNIEMRF